jgi:hypothetical protein
LHWCDTQSINRRYGINPLRLTGAFWRSMLLASRLARLAGHCCSAAAAGHGAAAGAHGRCRPVCQPPMAQLPGGVAPLLAGWIHDPESFVSGFDASVAADGRSFLHWLAALSAAQLMLGTALSWLVRDKPGVLAFELLCVVPTAYLGLIGLTEAISINYLSWDWDMSDAQVMARVWGSGGGGGGSAGAAEHLLGCFAAYSVWGALVCTALRPLRNADILAHHYISAVAGVMIMRCRWCYPYGCFFCGVQELSSFVLCFVDIMKEFPALRSAFPAGFFGAKAAFAIMFVLIRNVIWPVVFWRQVRDAWVAHGITTDAGAAGDMATLALIQTCVFTAQGVGYELSLSPPPPRLQNSRHTMCPTHPLPGPGSDTVSLFCTILLSPLFVRS